MYKLVHLPLEVMLAVPICLQACSPGIHEFPLLSIMKHLGSAEMLLQAHLREPACLMSLHGLDPDAPTIAENCAQGIHVDRSNQKCKRAIHSNVSSGCETDLHCFLRSLVFAETCQHNFGALSNCYHLNEPNAINILRKQDFPVQDEFAR
jgi:hypothetical protein